MQDRVLFWCGLDFTQFCMAYYFQKKCDCEMYSIIDITNNTKTFFQNQKLVHFKKIWFLHDQYQYETLTPDFDYLKNFEKKYKVNLWQLALNERIFYGFFNFHKFTTNEILSIVEQICRFYEKIFDEIKPNYFITKLTAFHHLELFRRMCLVRGVKVLMLSNPKIPKQIIISEDDTKIDYVSSLDNYPVEFNSFTEIRNYYNELTSNVLAKDLVENFWQNHGSNSIFKTLRVFCRFMISPNTNLKTNYNYYGMTKFKVLKNFTILRIKKMFRELYIDMKLPKIVDTDIPYVFFPLSIVLERAVLINAPYCINQLELVRHIAKSLPMGYRLLIKEHPVQGSREWRKISEYKEFLEIPNTLFLHPNSNDESLMKNASLIITTAGSIGFQSALYEKPCLIFGKVLYAYLPSIKKIDSIERLPDLIRQSLSIKPNLQDLSKYMSMLKPNLVNFDFLQFLKEFNHEFTYDGGFADVKINEPKLKNFIENHKVSLETLANAHINKIFQHKNLQSKN